MSTEPKDVGVVELGGIEQAIRWLRIARDYLGELPEFDDPENTVKGIEAHVSAAIAKLEPLVKGEVVAEGSARPIYGSASPWWEFFDSWYPEGADPAVLVIRAAGEEIGGKE